MKNINGVWLKTWPFDFCYFKIFYLISVATNMLEGWELSNLKGEFQSSVWSTKTFLYRSKDINKLRLSLSVQLELGSS